MRTSQSAWQDVHHQKFRSPAAKARNPHLPNSRTKATIFLVGQYTLMEELALLMVKPWPAVALSLARVMEEHIYKYIMFGPVITTEAHLAYAGARIHSNTTAELSNIVDAFLSWRGCP